MVNEDTLLNEDYTVGIRISVRGDTKTKEPLPQSQSLKKVFISRLWCRISEGIKVKHTEDLSRTRGNRRVFCQDRLPRTKLSRDTTYDLDIME